jgi:hypothetical protein
MSIAPLLSHNTPHTHPAGTHHHAPPPTPQVKALFASLGRITNSKVTGAAGTRAFVTFEDATTADKALALNGSVIGGGAIAVTLDIPTRRRRTGGGGAAEAGAAGGEGPRKASVFVGNLNPEVHDIE